MSLGRTARWAAVAIASCVLASACAGISRIPTPTLSRSPVELVCPVSEPRGPIPPKLARMNFGSVLITARHGWLANGSLWVDLPRGAVFPATQGLGAMYRTKIGWFRAVPGQVRVSGQPVFGGGAAFGSNVGTVPEYGPTGFVPSILRFGRPGCWHLTATLAGSRLDLTVVIRSSPQP